VEGDVLPAAATRVRARDGGRGKASAPAPPLGRVAPLRLVAESELEQRRGLGILERRVRVRPPAAAVLAMRAKHRGEERRRQLVVLLVRLLRQRRDRGRRHPGDGGGGQRRGRGGVAVVELGEPRLQQVPDAEADDAVGHEAPFDPTDGHGRAIRHALLSRTRPVSCA
jgi:hypothetical protein